MKYVLFLLLFSTPPAPHVDTAARKAKAVWTLKSSSTMEFATPAACKINGQTILDSLDVTDTVTGVGWCFCESAPGGECPADQESSDRMKSMMTSKSVKPQDFDLPQKNGPPEQVSVGAIKLLPKSLADAQKAAEQRALSAPKSKRH
jgi:hypothetical protein